VKNKLGLELSLVLPRVPSAKSWFRPPAQWPTRTSLWNNPERTGELDRRSEPGGSAWERGSRSRRPGRPVDIGTARDAVTGRGPAGSR